MAPFLLSQSMALLSLPLLVLCFLIIVLVVVDASRSSFSSSASASTDVVASLPGFTGPLPTRMWSGLVESLPGMHSHYILAECTAPPCATIAWFQGGPGASSMYGMFVAFGPLVFKGSDVKLNVNPYRWTHLANTLVIDSPPPVGFSYCDPAGPSGNGTSCGPWDDASTASVNDAALRAWAKRHPQHAANGLIIAGESYAGVYVPTLVKRLVENVHDPPPFKVLGAAVGDPCAPPAVCGVGNAPLFHVLFAHGHGQMSYKNFEAIMNACGGLSGLARLDAPSHFDGCGDALKRADVDAGKVYPYGEYDDCNHAGDPFRRRRSLLSEASEPRQWFLRRPSIVPLEEQPPPPPPFHAYPGGVASGGAPCGSLRALGAWLAEAETKTALNVPATSNFFECDNGVGFNYTLSEKNVLAIWSDLVQRMPVLVYNGDTDPGLNFYVTQNWTSKGIAGIVEREAWRPWTVDGNHRLGGFVTRYASEGAGRFDFATIHGSGHMVPAFKPVQALALFEQWMSNAFKRYAP